MPYQCRLLPEAPEHSERCIGDMWYANRDPRYSSIEYLSGPASSRPPIMVILPSGFPFCVDSPYSGSMDASPAERHGWTVTGEAPKITLSPSINEEGYYHGWLINGVLSDDLEGRAQHGRARE